ncbi:aldo/keto reductase [Klebsiella pneumoniae]|nr:aldo/keto reductase [Klebsiella pneumoniae]MBW4946370.1 GNAT family N-acetyltransferase [Klebsiella pneumoniae]MDW7541301.1 aldo/keto reductase [Klebsiella pneumoniae]HDG9146429.1 GNAT family N-acetyltransferase [Klebsiella pneumoniae]
MLVQTNRLYLRPVISSDLNDLFKIYGDPATNTFNPAGPYPNIDHAKMVMNRWLDHWQTHSFGNWAISPLTNPEKIIGFGGLGIRNYDEYVNLGRSGLKVSRLCLGCMSYGEPERLPQPWSLDEKASRPLIRQALEAGINFFDTANIYSGGSSEEITGKALREMARRDEIVVATKTFFPWRNSPNTGFLSRKAIFQSIDDSLMRLGMDYVDLFQIHRFDYSTPVEETMEALHDVVKAGKARYIGASSMEAWRFAKMQHTAERNGWTRFITMQPQYNLLYREEEREMLPLCEDQGVGVIPWSPMARGRLTRDWSVTSRRTQNDAFALKMYENAALLDKPVIDVVASIAEKHAVPRAHVAIAWLLSKSVITAPIIGATKPEHLSTAISALDFSLSDAEITELEARYLPHPVDGIIPPLPDTPPSLTPPSAIQNY